MSNKNNAKKGSRSEASVAKGIKGKRLAGPNQTDVKKGNERIEVKNYKNPLTKKQLQDARSQNNANIVVSTKGFTPEAIEHAKKNMPKTQLRSGENGENLVKRRR